jgi:hypothetical protein
MLALPLSSRAPSLHHHYHRCDFKTVNAGHTVIESGSSASLDSRRAGLSATGLITDPARREEMRAVVENHLDRCVFKTSYVERNASYRGVVAMDLSFWPDVCQEVHAFI